VRKWSITDVSEVLISSVFKVEVGRVCERQKMYVGTCFNKALWER
jgi:hypothetical protein